MVSDLDRISAFLGISNIVVTTLRDGVGGGTPLNEVQAVTVNATGGTFRLAFGGPQTRCPRAQRHRT